MTTNPLSRTAAMRRLMLMAAALAALALPVAETSAATAPGFGLRVFTGDNPNLLTFHSANCSVGKKNGFEAFAHLNGWRLLVSSVRSPAFTATRWCEVGSPAPSWTSALQTAPTNLPVTSSRRTTSPAAVRSISPTTAA